MTSRCRAGMPLRHTAAQGWDSVIWSLPHNFENPTVLHLPHTHVILTVCCRVPKLHDKLWQVGKFKYHIRLQLIWSSDFEIWGSGIFFIQSPTPESKNSGNSSLETMSWIWFGAKLAARTGMWKMGLSVMPVCLDPVHREQLDYPLTTETTSDHCHYDH